MPISGGELLGSLHAAQHQQMLLGMMGGANSSGAAAEALAGGAMSRGLSVAGPMGMMGLGLMGLDPLSLGMRAGMGAWRGGAGLMGVAGAGMAAALPMTMGLAGVGYATGQMGVGAQQQLQLNQALRQFNFMNSQGGMGFTPGQGFQVGGMLRQMTHEFGPQGEVQTFGELSRLASNMGRMGLAQNVRSVQEFKEKFKEMVTTLKTVAHDLGTSLEEAQKFVVAMKGSGIFRSADQLRMTSGVRSMALAGGLAMSEVSGAASIGSQISRSVGGLGRQGAFGGMATMGILGVAQRVGAVSEEDIYNATGLTGAEGRQAFAASQMQRSASFLTSGRGRRFLASIAGEDGRLNEDAVSEWMAGGMTTQRTMQLAHQNLRGTGRADFIRNEGRLRGAALERFGGMVQTMAYKEWLSSRGYSPDNMDDKAMLAFQRFTGMGRDEADVAVKQINALPEMMRELQSSRGTQAFSDEMNKRYNTTGIEGLRRKADQVREQISGSLQQAGSRVLQAGQESIEAWFNELMGVYTAQATQGIEGVEKSLLSGGTGGKDTFRRSFGMAGQFSDQSLMTGLTRDIISRNKLQKLRMSADAGTSDPAFRAFAEKNREAIRIASLGGASGGYDDTIKSFREMVANTHDDALMEKFDKGGRAERLAIVQSMQRSAGMSEKNTVLQQIKNAPGQNAFNLSNFRTTAEREDYFGNVLTGQGGSGGETSFLQRAGVNSILGMIPGIGGMAVAANEFFSRGTGKGLMEMGASAYRRLSGETDERRAFARFFIGGDKEQLGMLTDILTGSEDQQKAARERLLDTINEARAGKKFGDLGPDTRGTIGAATSMYLSSDPNNKAIIDKIRAGKPVSDAEYKKLASQYAKISGNESKDFEDLKKEINAVARNAGSALAAQHDENARKMIGMVSSRTASERERAISVGLAHYKDGKLQLDESKLDSSLSADARAAARLAFGAATMTVNDLGDLKAYYGSDGVKGAVEASEEAMSRLSLEEKRKLARAGGAVGDAAGYQAQVEERWTRMGKRGGIAGALAGSLGVSLNERELRGLKGMERGDMVKQLLGASGIGDDPELQKRIEAALGEGTAGGRAFKVQQVINDPEVQKKLEAAKTKQQEQSDPTFKVLNQHLPEQTKLLKALVSSNEKAAEALAKIDPEKPKEGA